MLGDFFPFYLTQLKISAKTRLKNNDMLHQKHFYVICCRDFFSFVFKKTKCKLLRYYIYFLKALRKMKG